ncbi:hypothetical protein ABZU32_40715 [Sphaerisporangium sp. NPDC005288]
MTARVLPGTGRTVPVPVPVVTGMTVPVPMVIGMTVPVLGESA